MEVGEQCPLLSNAIEMRGVVVGAVRANALRTNIINKYKNDTLWCSFSQASFDDDIIAWHENDGSQGFTKHIIIQPTNAAECSAAHLYWIR